MWIRKRTENLLTSCTSYQLNPHDQLGRLCVYGIYKRTMWDPTEEKAVALADMHFGGKNTRQYDHIRVWAVPTAGPESSPVLEGILGRQRWAVTHSKQKNTGRWYLKKTFIIILLFWFVLQLVLDFSSFLPLLLWLLIWLLLLAYLSFWELFLNNTFYFLYILLHLCWPFAVLWSFSNI